MSLTASGTCTKSLGGERFSGLQRGAWQRNGSPSDLSVQVYMDVNMPIVRNGEFCCSQPITDIHQHSTGCAFPETLTTGAAQTRPCNLTCSYSQKGNCRRLALIDTDEKSLYQLRGPRRPCRSSAISQLTQQQQQTFRCPISSRQTAKGRLGMPLLVIASVSGRTSEPVGRMAERQKGFC